MKYFILIFSVLLSLNSLAHDSAHFRTTLEKLSKSLRGVPLTPLEQRQIKDYLDKGMDEEAVYQLAVNQFLSSPHFNNKLKFKVHELLRIKTEGFYKTNYDPDTFQVGANDSSLDYLIRDLISKNQSWDQLLLAKNYRYKYSVSAFGDTYNEVGFFAPSLGLTQEAPRIDQILPFNSPALDGKADFAADDNRIAGVITTPRFLNRYVNTALNKNRRRSAAIFRIFMCDPMIAAIPARDSNSEKADYDMIFPHEGASEEEIRRSVSTNLHGTQKDCMACHYKLDPMGQTLGFSAVGLHPVAAPGALNYYSKDGQQISIPVQGVGELAQKITEQRDYVRCQVNHFWNWYIGKDFPKSADREEELMKQFNNVGRKPKDFVKYLVSTPEFKAKPQILTEDQILARNAARILKNCNDCHRNQVENVDMIYWDLTVLPYPAQSRVRDINKLKKVLDINGDGSKRSMPPSSSVWKLGDEQYSILKKWLQSGAPDYSGQKQVTP